MKRANCSRKTVKGVDLTQEKEPATPTSDLNVAYMVLTVQVRCRARGPRKCQRYLHGCVVFDNAVSGAVSTGLTCVQSGQSSVFYESRKPTERAFNSFKFSINGCTVMHMQFLPIWNPSSAQADPWKDVEDIISQPNG